jgi:hypothetical protein
MQGREGKPLCPYAFHIERRFQLLKPVGFKDTISSKGRIIIRASTANIKKILLNTAHVSKHSSVETRVIGAVSAVQTSIVRCVAVVIPVANRILPSAVPADPHLCMRVRLHLNWNSRRGWHCRGCHRSHVHSSRATLSCRGLCVSWRVGLSSVCVI